MLKFFRVSIKEMEPFRMKSNKRASFIDIPMKNQSITAKKNRMNNVVYITSWISYISHDISHERVDTNSKIYQEIERDGIDLSDG